jgi:hypothetical protein
MIAVIYFFNGWFIKEALNKSSLSALLVKSG